jgi:hypothetical protein
MFEDLYPKPEPTPVPEQSENQEPQKPTRRRWTNGPASIPTGAGGNGGMNPPAPPTTRKTTTKKINVIKAVTPASSALTQSEIGIFAYALHYYRMYDSACPSGPGMGKSIDMLLDDIVQHMGLLIDPMDRASIIAVESMI